jgi:hypothetical protein
LLEVDLVELAERGVAPADDVRGGHGRSPWDQGLSGASNGR